jgi:transcriptional regulator with XRE-family HTH domain
MQEVILQISNRIKEKRKEKKITLQELANEAGVTKGLISQIENNRTVPSLMVLLNIIKALGVDFNSFFEQLHISEENEAILIHPQQHELIHKEYSKGSFYHRILSLNHNEQLVDVVLYRQLKNAKRGFVSTNAFEFDYMLKGEMEYTIGTEKKKYVLKEGDAFYYDARKPHLSRCLSEEEYIMLVIYFFES